LLTFLISNFKTNPSPTKIPRSGPSGRAKPRGANNTWVTSHEVARLMSTVALEKVASDVVGGSRHTAWRESYVSHAMHRGVTQLRVAPRSVAWLPPPRQMWLFPTPPWTLVAPLHVVWLKY
jgi:hypothetical protein